MAREREAVKFLCLFAGRKPMLHSLRQEIPVFTALGQTETEERVSSRHVWLRPRPVDVMAASQS